MSCDSEVVEPKGPPLVRDMLRSNILKADYTVQNRQVDR